MQNKTRYVIALGLSLSAGLMARAQTAADSTARDTTSIMLNEVSVVAETQFKKDDHVVLLLNKRNRNYGTNALDAVSTLNRFQSSLNSTELISWNQKPVFVLINGVPANGMELRAYKASDIKSVEYYDLAPPQYAAFTSGPVANIIMRKRHDRLYTGYFNTQNAINTGFGTNQVSLTYSDSLNQVKINDFFGYRDYHHIASTAEYVYPWGDTNLYNGTQKYNGIYNNISASYQRYQGSHLFNAKASYLTDRARNDEQREATIEEGGLNESESGSYLQETHASGLSLNLYYRLNIAGGKALALTVDNSVTNARSESRIATIDPQHVLASDNRNRTYMLRTDAFYTTNMLGAMSGIGVYYKYKSLKPTHDSPGNNVYSHDNQVNWALVWNKPLPFAHTIYPTIGYQLISQKNGDRTYTTITPKIRLYLDAWGSGAMEGTSAQLTWTLQQNAPSLGNVTRTTTYIDNRFLAVGNPDLHSYWYTMVNLGLHYFRPKSQDRFSLVFRPKYSRRPFMSVIGRESDIITLRPVNIKSDFDMEISANISYSPLPWLQLEPYVELYLRNYDTPSTRIRSRYLRYGGVISFLFNKWDINLAANSPTKDFDGDLTVRGSAQYAFIAQYKLRNWTLGAEIHYFGHDECTTGTGEKFYYSTRRDMPSLHYLTQFVATYSFSVGRSRRHVNVNTQTGDINEGIGSHAAPKAPKM